MDKIYDLIIVGAGPAGLTASIYASRYKLSNLVLGKKPGGTVALAHRIENWPGSPGVSGVDLMTQVEAQTKALGGEVIYNSVKVVTKPAEQQFLIQTESGQQYQAKAIIFAAGTERRSLNVAGETDYLGKGVSYCTTCDAGFFKAKTVAVIGGSNGAVSGGIHLAQFADKVYLIYRQDKLRAEQTWIDEWQKLVEAGIGETIYKTNITEIKGDGQKVTGVVLDQAYQGKTEIELNGVFIEIGGLPGTMVAQQLGVEVSENNYIKVDRWLKTNITGVFAAGDCTDFWPGFAQMISASAMGAVAASRVYEYLKGQVAPKILGV